MIARKREDENGQQQQQQPWISKQSYSVLCTKTNYDGSRFANNTEPHIQCSTHPPRFAHAGLHAFNMQGHIALARATFPEDTMGSKLDVLARVALWEAGLDYRHGTGHGMAFGLHCREREYVCV